MKVCTLRKVADGIVATVDELYKEGDYYLNLKSNKIFYCEYNKRVEVNKDNHKIIASTFGEGKELCIIEDNEVVPIDLYQGSRFHIAEFIESIDGTIEYPYTETETQIIINL